MDWLGKVYMKVESQKLELERVNKSLKILFKAWPNKDEEVIESKDIQSQPKDSKATELTSTPTLTEEEKEGVDLVNELLQKAQKARNVQKKLEQPKRTRNSNEAQNKSSADKSLTQAKEDLSSKNGIVKASEPRNHETSTKPTQNSTNKNLKPVNSNVKVTAKKEAPKKTTNPSSAKYPDIKPNKYPTMSKNNPSEGSGSNKSTGRRVTPAHVSAPFQTNPRLASSKLKTEYSASTGKVITSARTSSAQTSTRVKGSYSAPLKRQVAKETENRSTVAMAQKPVLNRQMDRNRNNETPSGSESDQNISSEDVETATSEASSSNSNEIGNKLDPTDVRDRPTEEMNALDKNDSHHSLDKNCFTLAKDGHSLSLPGKYRKLSNMNRKLRQKIFTQHFTKKVDSPQPGRQFSVQLHRTFGDPDVIEIHKVARQAKYLVNVYRNLTELLQQLHLHNLDGDSSVENVLFAKKSLEHILSTFHETEAFLQSLNLDALKTVDSNSSSIKTCCKPDHHSLRIWFPHTHLDLPEERTLRYKSCKQMERYTGLVHRAQLLQLKIDSMDVLAQQTLPLLQALSPDSSEFIQVLRCAYSLLSTNPNRVPVIVKDTILDDTEIEEPDCT